jgi:hypothetical protein
MQPNDPFLCILLTICDSHYVKFVRHATYTFQHLRIFHGCVYDDIHLSFVLPPERLLLAVQASSRLLLFHGDVTL